MSEIDGRDSMLHTCAALLEFPHFCGGIPTSERDRVLRTCVALVEKAVEFAEEAIAKAQTKEERLTILRRLVAYEPILPPVNFRERMQQEFQKQLYVRDREAIDRESAPNE